MTGGRLSRRARLVLRPSRSPGGVRHPNASITSSKAPGTQVRLQEKGEKRPDLVQRRQQQNEPARCELW